jgi:hypothetical protein
VPGAEIPPAQSSVPAAGRFAAAYLLRLEEDLQPASLVSSLQVKARRLLAA